MTKVPPPSFLRRWWLPITIGACALAAVLGWRRLAAFDWAAAAAVYQHIDWAWMAPGALVVLWSYLTRVLRWQIMLRPLAPAAPFGRLLSATLIGFTAVVILGRPGELVRPYLIARNERVPVTSQVAAWLLERVYDLLAVLLLFGIGLATFDSPGRPLGPALQWVFQMGGLLIAVLGGAALVFLIAASRGGDAMARRLTEALGFLPPPLLDRATALLGSFTGGLSSCQCGSDVARILFYTVLEWGAIVGACFCIFQAFPQTAALGWLDVIVYLGFVSFGSIVQIPGVGGGVQIVSVVVLTQLFGVEAAPAAGIAIASWLTTWVVVVPFGLVLAARQGLSWGSLKSINKEIAS